MRGSEGGGRKRAVSAYYLGRRVDRQVGEATAPRRPPTLLAMCPIFKRLFVTRYAHRISSPLEYAMSILFAFTSLLSAHILKKTQASSSAGASFNVGLFLNAGERQGQLAPG
jgi:hypothetical protein